MRRPRRHSPQSHPRCAGPLLLGSSGRPPQCVPHGGVHHVGRAGIRPSRIPAARGPCSSAHLAVLLNASRMAEFSTSAAPALAPVASPLCGAPAPRLIWLSLAPDDGTTVEQVAQA